MPPDLATCLLAASDIRAPAVPLWALELGADIFLGAWLLFVGASIGSFLNVVVYRLPRKINLMHPSSRCPQCLHPIRLRDNIPILSWLLLGGRCRDCQSPISPRYFVIELLLAAMFLTVWLVEANVTRDFSSPEAYLGRRALQPHSGYAFWCAYATHVMLVATLIGATLIVGDGFRVPARLYLPVLAVGLTLPIAWPEIRRVPAFRYEQVNHWQAGLIDGLVGAGLGAVLALLAACSWALWGRARPTLSFALLIASLGAVLGWQRLLLFGPGILLLGAAIAGILRASRPPPEAPDQSPPAAAPTDPVPPDNLQHSAST